MKHRNTEAGRGSHAGKRWGLLVVVGLLAFASFVPSAFGAKGKLTGNYVGEAVHPALVTDAGEVYTTNIVVRIYKGVLTGIGVEARMECPDIDAIMDVEYHSLSLSKKDRVKLNKKGAFNFSKNGIHVAGHAGKKAASGSISASNGAGCSVSGVTWTAEKNRF
jgi:hypothetical protein